MDWKHILQSSPAQALANSGADPGARTALAALTDLALIRVSGDDAAQFLQGQLSNDIRLLDTNPTQLSAYCNPKGRVLALFRIFKTGNDYNLLLPATLAEATTRRLQMFVMRSKVDIKFCQDRLLLGVIGNPSCPGLPKLPADANPVIHDTTDDIALVSLNGNTRRTLLSAPSGFVGTLWQSSSGIVATEDAAGWRLLDIEEGIPQVFEETVDQFIPQMINLDILDGVNFKKGCYPGQEIVARMRYLGKLKKRMYLGTIDSQQCPQPGAPVFSESFGEQAAGSIVDARVDAMGLCKALVSCQISGALAHDLHMDSQNGPPITLLPMPYSIEDNTPA
ncbi:MAG: folate-binding protein [Gammaproteobacteria bacterium]|nr:folate-binding protein [Gammaproteobacteria bacterium]